MLFRVAAGPRLGFGHLVRCSRLAAVLQVPFRVALRGPTVARRVATDLGATLDTVTPDALRRCTCDVLVVDDPGARAARPWLSAARRAALPCVSIHDLGLGAHGADVMVDGTLGAPHVQAERPRWHAGPRFAVLDPAVRDLRRRSRPTGQPRVLVALGGGPRRAALWGLAAALRQALPGASILAAPGLRQPSPAWAERLERLGVDVVAPEAFLHHLARADVAVLAGGVSLYEAAALGVPTVAVAVVDAQVATVRAFGHAGWAVDGGRLRTAGPPASRRIARLTRALLADEARRRTMAKRARAGVDGRGAGRVAAVLLRAWRERGAPCGAACQVAVPGRRPVAGP